VQNVVTYDAVVGVDNKELLLKPGMTANVEFLVSRKTDVLKISNSQFDDFKWVSLEEGLALCDKIEQSGKKRIMIGALNELRKIGLL